MSVPARVLPIKQPLVFGRMTRVSTPGQAKEGYSLDVQDELLIDLIQDHGHTTRPELLFIDDGYEGDDWNRPAINEGLKGIADGRMHGLAFQDTERFSRDPEGAWGFIRKVRNLGGTLLFGDVGMLQDDENFELILGIKFSIGRFQKRKTKALSRINMQRRAKIGNIMPGRVALYGYEYYVDAAGLTKYRIHPVHGPIVRQIVKWRLERMGLREIVRRLIAKGIEPPLGAENGHWNLTTISDICGKDETYLGTWVYNRTERCEPRPDRIRNQKRHCPRSAQKPRPREQWIKVEIPALMTQMEFDAMAAMAEENRHTLGGRPSDKYLLTGLFFCARCNGAIRGYAKGGSVCYYCCAERDREQKHQPRLCEAGSVRLDVVEPLVLQVIEDTVGNERALEGFIERHRRELAAQADQGAAEALQGRLGQLQRRLTKARNEALKCAAAADDAGEQYYDGEVAEMQKQRLELTRELQQMTSVVDLYVDAKTVAARVRKGLKVATRMQLKGYLKTLVARITFDDRTGEVEVSLRVPVSNCQHRQADADSFILFKTIVKVAA